MFDEGERECTQRSEDCIQRIQSQVDDVLQSDTQQQEDQYLNDPKIKKYLEVLQLFANYNLLEDSSDRFKRMFRQVERTQTLIDEYRLHQLNTHLKEADKQLHVMVSQLHENSITKDYSEVIKVVCNLQEVVDSQPDFLQLHNDVNQTHLESRVKQAYDNVDRIIKMISQDAQDLFRFAFHLRKLDRSNKYTKNVLQGRVKPQILIDIISSNYWSESGKCMMADQKQSFRFVQSNGYSI